MIRDYLAAARVDKRSSRNDEQYGDAWIEWLGGRSLEEVLRSDREKIRVERLAGRLRRADDDKDKKPRPVTPATVNREYAFLKHVFNVPIRDGKAERNPVAKLKMLDATALVFPNSLGNTDLHWAEKDFLEAVADAEIPDLRLHNTRYTFASRLAMEGVDLRALKEPGGWKTLSMVQRYAHLSAGHQRQAIERLVTRSADVPRPAGAAGSE